MAGQKAVPDEPHSEAGSSPRGEEPHPNTKPLSHCPFLVQVRVPSFHIIYEQHLCARHCTKGRVHNSKDDRLVLGLTRLAVRWEREAENKYLLPGREARFYSLLIEETCNPGLRAGRWDGEGSLETVYAEI